MYDKDSTTEAKTARLAALKVGVAWAMHYQMPRILPKERGEHPEAEVSFFGAVDALAQAAGDTSAHAESIVRGDYGFLMRTLRQVNEEVEGDCPNHPVAEDLCHGTFAEFFPDLAEQFGMTPEEALAYLTGLHRVTELQCPGFTATPAALAGCTRSDIP